MEDKIVINNSSGKYVVSIITVTYNAENSVEKTILSVLNQQDINIEFIVIDGASRDKTLTIIEKFSNRISKIVSEPDKGVYDAMNKGIKMANGEWLLFLNAGDTLANNNTISSIFSNKIPDDTSVIYGDTFVINSFARYTQLARPLESIKNALPFCHQSALIRRISLQKHNYDTRLKICADYALFYSLWKEGATFIYVHNTISVYDQSGPGLSNSNIMRYKKELIKIHDNSLFNSLRELLSAYSAAIRDRILKKFFPIRYRELIKRNLMSNSGVCNVEFYD